MAKRHVYITLKHTFSHKNRLGAILFCLKIGAGYNSSTLKPTILSQKLARNLIPLSLIIAFPNVVLVYLIVAFDLNPIRIK